MHQHITESSKSIPALFDKLRGQAKRLYPDEKFVQFKNVPLPSEQAAENAVPRTKA